MDFSEKIKMVLHSKSITPTELARQMGYTPQYISDLLLGKRRWNEVTMNKACKALNLQLILKDTSNAS